MIITACSVFTTICAAVSVKCVNPNTSYDRNDLCIINVINPNNEYLDFISRDSSKLKLSAQGSYFEKAPTGLVAAYPNLEDLELDMCRIKQIDDNTFVGARQLMKLNLAANQISNLTSSTFNGLHYLEILNLVGVTLISYQMVFLTS